MILEKEAKLFEKWSKCRQGFSKDGVINEDSYSKSAIKLMFILKEVNDKTNSGVNLKELLKNGAPEIKATWNTVALWIYGIYNLESDLNWTNVKNLDINKLKKELLPSIIVLNLKKSPGKGTSKYEELEEAIKKDKFFIIEQFNNYMTNSELRPDFIIAGGSETSYLFTNYIFKPTDFKREQTSRGIIYYKLENGVFFIEFKHPAVRVSDNLSFYSLVDAIKEIKQLNLK